MGTANEPRAAQDAGDYEVGPEEAQEIADRVLSDPTVVAMADRAMAEEPQDVDMTVTVLRSETSPPAGRADPFTQLGADVMTPDFDPESLAAFPQRSSILPQCIEAMATNIDGFGYTFAPAFPDDEEENEEFLKRADAERTRADRFFANASTEYSFTELRRRMRQDIESVGWAVFEKIRDTGDELIGLEHLPARTVRLTRQSKEPVQMVRYALADDGQSWEEHTAWRYPRLYVQIIEGRKTYFKAPGDPREINRKTGLVVTEEDRQREAEEEARIAGTGMANEHKVELATELIWFGSYNPAGPYPVPRWIGTLISAAGARKFEEINYNYADNKSVPPFVVLVSGGVLPQKTKDYLTEKWQELKGVDNFHKALVIEAVGKGLGSATGAFDPGRGAQVKVEIEKLADVMHGDALFMDYDKASRNKVRSAFGLPPIFTGESQDYTRATAQVSMEVAERGTFSPPRLSFDDSMNRWVMSDLEILYWRFQSNGPPLANPEDAVEAIKAGLDAGVGGPNVWAEVLEKLTGVKMPRSDEKWGDVPFKITQLAVSAGAIVPQYDEDDRLFAVEINEEARERFVAEVHGVVRHIVESVLDEARALDWIYD